MPYGSARLPQGNARQIEVEKSLADCKAEGGKASLSPELFWSKDVILFEGKGKGSKIEVPFDVPEDGDYEVYTEVAQASDYGIYTVLLDGKPPQAPQLEHEPGADVRPQTQFDGYALETYVGLAHQVGWVHLAKGRHTLTYVCLGKREASSGYNLGVDNIVLARVGPEAWAAAAKVKEPRLPKGNAVDLGQTLVSDPDPVTRGLAALALRDQGRGAVPALSALTAALKDSDVCVRMMSANAMAGHRPGGRARRARADCGRLGQGRAGARAPRGRGRPRQRRQAGRGSRASAPAGARQNAARPLGRRVSPWQD